MADNKTNEPQGAILKRLNEVFDNVKYCKSIEVHIRASVEEVASIEYCVEECVPLNEWSED